MSGLIIVGVAGNDAGGRGEKKPALTISSEVSTSWPF